MNVPNLLSLMRLGLVPVFAWVFFSPIPNARYWAAGIYALAFLTDILDGYIARRFHMVTPLGRVLDPMADKLMTFAVILCICIAGIIPKWAVVIFFCKELILGVGGLILFHNTKDVIPANWLGKASTGVFFLVLGVLVLFPDIPQSVAVALISVALALAVVALLRYAQLYRQVM